MAIRLSDNLFLVRRVRSRSIGAARGLCTRKRPAAHLGAALLELVLVLPLLLLGIFYIVWNAQIGNERGALVSAVTLGIRSGITRGNPVLSGENPNTGAGALLPSLSTIDWTDEATQRLLAAGPATLVADAPLFYQTWTETVFPGSTFETLPREYIYSLVYTLNHLRDSLGSRVRFPCLPDGEEVGSGPTTQGPGCVACRFVNPSATSQADAYNAFTDCATPANCSAPVNRFGIQCLYQPDNLVLDPIFQLTSLLTGERGRSRFVLRWAAWYNVDLPAGF